MSTYFDAPISGSGNGTIVINAKTLNNGSSSRSAVLTISNGEKTANSTLSQRFKPTFQRSGSGNIPSSGGSMTVSVNSQYPFYFRNNPSNIGAITSGGVDYKDNPSINGGSWTFNVSVGANATTSGKTETLEMAFQKLDGTYSFNNPDAGDYAFSFYQESGSTTPIGIISISTPANVAASATSIPYSVTANMQSTINTFKDNVLYSTFSVQSGITSGNLSISANGNSASPITYRFEGSTSDNQGFATASTIQNAADAPIVSGNTVNVPIYFDSDEVNIWIGLGQALPFVLRPSVVIEHSRGNRELINYVIPISETAVTFDDGNNQPFYVSDFDTSLLNYVSIVEVYAGSGAPAYTVTYGDTEYYIYWSEDYSSNLKTYLENVGNNCLDDVVWGEEPYVPIDYSTLPFTIEALSAGTLSWNASGLTYSKNGGAWTTWNSASTLSVSAGDTVRFKSDKVQKYKNKSISGTGAHKVYGNLNSITSGKTALYRDEFASLFLNDTGLVDAGNLILAATSLTQYCYSGMFYGCSNLVNAPVLPATTLTECCYLSMFEHCTSLVNAPELPATTLARKCYSYMFYGCTSLVNAPELPATTLTDYCYESMFGNCTSLVNAPELPASSLVNSCYYQMFKNCSNLSYVKCLAYLPTNDGALPYVTDWLLNAGTGTFVKDSRARYDGTSLSANFWLPYNSGIPNGWTVVDAT